MNCSQTIQSPTLKGSKKLSIPKLNQLPFIPRNKASNSPRAHRRRDFEAQLLANKEAMMEKTKDTQSSQRVIKENLNASQVNKQMTISGLLKLREEKLTESQMSNANRSGVFPKLKLATLKDKIIILKKKDKETDNQNDQKNALKSYSSSIRRIKSKSEIPQEFLEQTHKSPRSPDLLEALQDYMFQKKKNEIIDQEQESTITSQKFPMFSPRTSTQNLEQYKNSHQDISLRHSFFVPQPSTTTKKRTPSLKISLNSQCIQEITSDEYGFDEKNEVKITQNKGHHKRGNSWSQNKEETNYCRVLNKEWTPAYYNNFVSSENATHSPSKHEKQVVNQDQGSLPNIYSIDSPRHFIHQFPSEMSKSKVDFNLKINPVQKKNDVPSSESRKNNVLPTTCSTGTKRESKGKIPS